MIAAGLDVVVHGLVEDIRREQMLDSRTTVWEVSVGIDGEALNLSGASSDPCATDALLDRLAAIVPAGGIVDRIQRLPEPSGQTHALVRVPAAPLLAAPLISEAPVSQVVLGHPLRVLRRWERWLQCRALDGYLGWVHRGYTRDADDDEARIWTGDDSLLAVDAALLGYEGEVSLRLPWGARMLRAANGSVRLPDGRTGEIRGRVVAAADRASAFPGNGDAVVASALAWLGTPYLWGGVTRAGVDCSGLVQAVLGMHGVSLPRDSDQQAGCGEPREPGAGFSLLRPGDLLFFAEEGARVTHVALSAGGSRIVHASLGNGGVACNDLAGGTPFERELRGLFVFARRVLGARQPRGRSPSAEDQQLDEQPSDCDSGYCPGDHRSN